MTKFTFACVFALATIATVLAPLTTLAQGRPIQGAFAVTYAGTFNTTGASYCDPTNTVLPLVAEAHGDGYSSLGALSFALVKGLGFDGTLHGCLTLSAPNGDTLNATYVGASSPANANNFAPASGTLTFTGGTGQFRGATGMAKFTAYFANLYPGSSIFGGTTAPIQGMAFYVVAGTVSFNED